MSEGELRDIHDLLDQYQGLQVSDEDVAQMELSHPREFKFYQRGVLSRAELVAVKYPCLE